MHTEILENLLEYCFNVLRLIHVTSLSLLKYFTVRCPYGSTGVQPVAVAELKYCNGHIILGPISGKKLPERTIVYFFTSATARGRAFIWLSHLSSFRFLI